MNREVKFFLDYLNDRCTYIVLRNWDNLAEDGVYENGHEDIDILCENLDQFVSLTKAERIHPEENRDNFIVPCGAIKIRIDARWVGDGYFPMEMEKTMLENRVYDQRGFYIPSQIDNYYSLSYHALIQKPLLSNEYKKRISKLRQPLFGTGIPLTEAIILNDLRTYLNTNHWEVEYPNDPGVYLNQKIVRQLPLNNNLSRIVYRLFFMVKRTLLSFFRRFLSKL